eukprot:TRINITY_DN7866_c0_g1_i1.p1 TRINITY_DN7866_c0_g1~~TRINITY_DN7866_c0_g1_i1.p1  ORF type:complete len:717 (-),score=229.90 TRINITY_DN7866_c0_g1_i1:43-2193(-)
MTAIIRFSPLYGHSDDEPLCYLLEVDDFRFLLDCGWTPQLDVKMLAPLAAVAKQVDAVLLSHPDLAHSGAIAYAVAKLGLTAPIYATMPIHKMGQMVLYEMYQSRHGGEDFGLFTLDDVDNAFEKFVQLKYSQRVPLAGRGAGIEITPHKAGHMIGGTVWKIKKETEEILYAVDYNHKKERHLEATDLDHIGRPTVLITDAFNALTAQESRKMRESQLHQNIVSTLTGGGNVLMPVDTSGRVLELLMGLDQYWHSQKNLHQFSIVFLSNVAFNTIEFAKSQLEWMNDSVMNAFEASRENPFLFKHIRLCHNFQELEAFSSPRVVLATPSDMEDGFARELFSEYSKDPKNMVLFTTREFPGTVAEVLQAVAPPPALQLVLKRRVPLEGEELEQYHAKKKREEPDEEKVELDSESESEDEDENTANSVFKNMTDMTVEQFSKIGFRHAMFPFVEKHLVFDDYGESYTGPMNIDSRPEESEEKESKMEIDEPKIEDNPTKCIEIVKSLKLACQIKYVDFEGRSDGRSIKTILQHVAPRKLILVHGSPATFDSLKKHCSKELKNCEIRIPANGENVHVTSDTNIYKMKLKDSLLEKLHFFPVGGDYEVAKIFGQIKFPTEPAESGSLLPMLEEIERADAPPHKPSFIGDVKLYDLRPLLLNAGFRIELQGGNLVVASPDGLPISIRKDEVNGKAQLKVEGIISEDYFRVRDIVYSQFTIL